MTIKKKMLQAASGAGGDDVILPVGVDFDGDYLSRSSDLVGNANGKTFTISAWFYLTTTSYNTGLYESFDSGSLRSYIYVNKIGQLVAKMWGESTAGYVLNVSSSSGLFAANTWNHILFSVDLSNTSNRSVYINDASASVNFNTYTNQNMDFTFNTFRINDFNSNRGESRLAGVYLDYTYRDLSVEANRRLFIDADGLYKKPPTSGIISVPMDDPDDVGRNDGTGGDFTLNGTVARSGRGPNQYNAVASTFDGTADYLSKTAITGASNGQKFTLSLSLSSNEQDGKFFEIKDRLYIGVFSGGTGDFKIRVLAVPSAGFPTIIRLETTRSLSFNSTYCIQVSVDSAIPTAKLIINGVDDTNEIGTATSDSFVFASTDVAVGAQGGTGASKVDGEIGNVYFNNSYIDLATNNPFYDASTNKPKYLGESGELPTGSSPLIYLPLRADDAGNNLGTGGDFTVNSGPFVGARGASEFIARSVRTPAGLNSLKRTTGLIGATDTKEVTLVFAFKGVSGVTNAMFGLSNGSLDRFDQRFGTDSFIILRNPSGSAESYFYKTGVNLTTGDWQILLFSMNTATNSGNFYLNGVSYNDFSYTQDSIFDHTVTDIRIGKGYNDAESTSQAKDTAFVYYDNTYIDFSQEANRLKFVDGLGFPIDLQPAIDAGDIPTPLIHMKFDDTSALGTNSGSGGDFTVNGTVTAGSDVKG